MSGKPMANRWQTDGKPMASTFKCGHAAMSPSLS
jgi:hypothetical protein